MLSFLRSDHCKAVILTILLVGLILNAPTKKQPRLIEKSSRLPTPDSSATTKATSTTLRAQFIQTLASQAKHKQEEDILRDVFGPQLFPERQEIWAAIRDLPQKEAQKHVEKYTLRLALQLTLTPLGGEVSAVSESWAQSIVTGFYKWNESHPHDLERQNKAIP